MKSLFSYSFSNGLKAFLHANDINKFILFVYLGKYSNLNKLWTNLREN